MGYILTPESKHPLPPFEPALTLLHRGEVTPIISYVLRNDGACLAGLFGSCRHSQKEEEGPGCPTFPDYILS